MRFDSKCCQLIVRESSLRIRSTYKHTHFKFLLQQKYVQNNSTYFMRYMIPLLVITVNESLHQFIQPAGMHNYFSLSKWISLVDMDQIQIPIML